MSRRVNVILAIASGVLASVIPSSGDVLSAAVQQPRGAGQQRAIKTAILFNANLTKNAVMRANNDQRRLYRDLDAAVAAKQRAFKKLGISERERRLLEQEIAELRAGQAELIRELEQKDIEYAAAIRAFREGLDGLFESRDPRIVAALQRYADGDLTALDDIRELTRIIRSAREAGMRARNGEEARGVAFLFMDARSKGQKTARQVLDAWTEAAMVDPDVSGSWIEISRIQLQLGDLDGAQDAAERARQTATEPKWLGAALDELGEIARLRDNLSEAEALRAEGLRIARQLIKIEPNALENRVRLSVALIKVGDTAMLLGKSEDAERAYMEALGIRRQLQAEFPRLQYPYRELGVALSRLARFKLRQNALAEAKSFSDESLRIFTRLQAMNPGDTFADFDMSIAVRVAADLALLQVRIDDAIELLKTAATISLRIWKADPQNEMWRREVAVTFDALISYELAMGRFDSALQHADSYINFAKNLISDDPGQHLSRIKLAVAMAYKGYALRGLGRKGSDDALFEAIRILEKIEHDGLSQDHVRELLRKIRSQVGGKTQVLPPPSGIR